MELTQSLKNFPQIQLLESGVQKDNVAPIILAKNIENEHLDTIVTLLRTCYEQGATIPSLGKILGTDIQDSMNVCPYVVSFGELKQILPMVVADFGCYKDFSALGWIPARESDMPSLDWKLVFLSKSYQDNIGFSQRIENTMEYRPERHSSNFMRFWLRPFIKSGFEFNPEKWNIQFSARTKLGTITDSVDMKGELYGSGSLLITNEQLVFRRESLDKTYQFRYGGLRPVKEAVKIPGNFILEVSEGMQFSKSTLERLSLT